MLRKYLFAILIQILVFPTLFGQILSDQVKLSLLTIAPTTELYNQFGHTAIRLHDPQTGLDLCYNYGVYDFNTPNFYAKFVRGQLPYMISVVETDRELAPYQRIQRGVIEQEFNLSPDEIRAVAAFLRENYKPKNRYYLYDFFYDNCATRIRDLFEDILETQLEDSTPQETQEKTFRDLLDEKIEMTPWNDFGIDFILGSNTDKKASFRDEMFLPEYLAKNISEYQYKGKPLLGPPTVIVENGIQIGSNTWLSPFNVFLLIFLLGLYLSFKGANRALKIFDGIFFFIFAFCGFFLLFMRLATDHEATWGNFNLLWANPLFLFAFLSLFMDRKWMHQVKWILLGFAFLNLILFWTPIQGFHRAIIPILLIIILRLSQHLEIWKLNRRQ